MTSFGPPYPMPRSAGEFQRLCLRLLRRHWQLPHLERFRDPERRESGIDLLEVSGRPALHAVRCELREMREAPSAAELKAAVDRAAALGLPIGTLVIATTAWRSKALKRALFDLNRALRVAGMFAVEVLCWEDIEELLDEYPDVMARFESTPKRQALSKADSRCRFEPRAVPIPVAQQPDDISHELDAAVALVERRDYQMARLRLMQLRERGWRAMNQGQKLALLTSLALAWLGEGEERKAAMLFIAGRSLGAEDESACTNEILAYELLGEYEHACSLAQTVSARFPASGRALALWLNNLPAVEDIAALRSRVPAALAGDPEVNTVLSRRALARGDYARAEEFARKAAQSSPHSADAWLLLGQAILLREIQAAAAVAGAKRVREAEECFSRAVSAATGTGAVGTEVQALIGRAQARIALRDADGAGRDIEAAHALEREDANGLCEYGILLRSRGELSDAIEIFRRAVRIGGRDDAEYHLGVTLYERAAPGDLQESVVLLGRAVRETGSMASDDYLFAVSAAVEALSALERWHEAEELLAEVDAQRVSHVALLTLKGRLELSRGNVSDAWRLADEALCEVSSEHDPQHKRKLAALLHDLGRYAEALVLWQSISAAGGGTAVDMRRLLECANRLGRDDIVLQALRDLKNAGGLGEGALEFEIELLERHDPERALERLTQHLKDHPEDRVMRLRRSVLARRLGRKELVADDTQSMPPAREVLPSLGRVAVQLMREAGRPNEALSYAYDLLRRNPADADAHRAYLIALGPMGAMPVVPDFETAQPGCAVCFVEPQDGAEQWVILEDSPEADEAAGEYGPTHPLTRQLRGRRPGDKFTLPDSTRLSRRSAVVKRIISKYAYRYQDCLNGWESRFPGLPEIEMVQSAVRAAPPEELPAAPTPVALPNGSRESALDSAVEAYRSGTLSIHGFAERAGLGDLQAVLALAARPGAHIKCCEGSEDELNAALSALERADTVVLDLSAIATLCLLGRLGLLKSWPRRFMIAQSTLHALRRLQFDELPVSLPAGFSAAMVAQEEDAPRRRPELELKTLADAIQGACAVADAGMLAALAPEQRDRLLDLFGRSGAESVVLASMPGRALWTDDMVLANFARAEFGVRRIWTQSALMARVRAGNLDPAELGTAGTKLAGWGYSFTTPSIETLMRAGSVAMWNPEEFPLKQVLDLFSTDRLKLGDAVILAAEFIVRMYADVYLRVARTSVTLRLLDRLAMRTGGREAIDALPQSLPIRFGLDLIRARELADAIRGWVAEHREEIAA